MKLIITDYSKFVSSVFGADCFIECFPSMMICGIEVEKRFNRYYIPEEFGGNDTTFFTSEEVQNCMKIIE